MTLASSVPTSNAATSSHRYATDEEIVKAVERLRRTFNSGVTRSLEWRLRELKQLERMISDNEDEIQEALQADLGKCRFESFVTETGFSIGDIQYALKHLKRWMKPRRVKASLAVQPASAKIHSDPLGVVLNHCTMELPVSAGGRAIGGRHCWRQLRNREAKRSSARDLRPGRKACTQVPGPGSHCGDRRGRARDHHAAGAALRSRILHGQWACRSDRHGGGSQNT